MPGIQRGEIWWLDLPDPAGSEPGGSRPVVVIQSDQFQSQSNRHGGRCRDDRQSPARGSPGQCAGFLRRVRVARGFRSQRFPNSDRRQDILRDRVGQLPDDKMRAVERGVALVLALKLAD